MTDTLLEQARQHLHALADTFPQPSFYRDHIVESARAQAVDSSSSLVANARERMNQVGDPLGHGFHHARKVALDAATIVFAESGINESADNLARLALMAGYLHDIRRDRSEHPAQAAEYVEYHYHDQLQKTEIGMICFAIRNHEAFVEPAETDNKDRELLSDVLYDADKFRWGPDNFLYTVWDMAASMNLTSRQVIKGYDNGIRGIQQVRESFRTPTGKKYGPEFIDIGLMMGEELISFLTGSDDR